MTYDIGRLISYRDDALPADEMAEVEAHLLICSECREELRHLVGRSANLDLRFVALDPSPEEVPDAGASLAAARATLGPTSNSYRWHHPVRNIKRRFNMKSSSRLSPNKRWAATGLIAVVLVGAVFSFAPVRGAAAEFLNIFRVESFEVVPVDEEQQARLDSFSEIVDSGGLLEPEFLREPSEPVPVQDRDEASEMAGFAVSMLPDLPEGVELLDMEVAEGPHMRFEVDREVAGAALALAGITDVELPDIETLSLEADVKSIVFQNYLIGGEEVSFIQSSDPTVVLPQGVSPQLLGEAYLQFLGLPAENASRLAATIDWTSTFVIPMPDSEVSYREVQVDGEPALLLRSKGQPNAKRESLLLWQKDGVVYAAGGADITSSLLIRAAEALE